MEKGSTPVRVGIVGLGRSGWGIHATQLQRLPEMFRVVAVADPLQERTGEAAARLGCRGCDGLERMLEDDEIELVVVASPNKYHWDQATAVLEAGRHVLCEKPFGVRVADVDRMIATSERAGRVLQPFQQRRYEPDFQKVKEICRSGLLGDIAFIRICWHSFKRRWDWQTLLEMGGGELNNNGPHLIDHALELFGDGAEPQVWCEKRRCLATGNAEDHVKIILSGEPGYPTIEVELSSAVVFGQDRWLVCGTAGGLHGDASGLEWKWVDWSAMPDRPVSAEPTPDRTYNSEPLEWHDDSWKPAQATDSGGGAAPAAEPSAALYRDLYRTIREGAPQVITPQSVRRRVAVSERCHQLSPLPKASA